MISYYMIEPIAVFARMSFLMEYVSLYVGTKIALETFDITSTCILHIKLSSPSAWNWFALAINGILRGDVIKDLTTPY